MIKDIWENCLDKVFNDPSVGKKPSVMLGDICNFFKLIPPRYFERNENDKSLRSCEGVIDIKVDKVYREFYTGKTKNEAKSKLLV
jgi:hypothetical protein